MYNDLVNDKTLDPPFPPHYKQILGKEIDIQEASEPTDIIWENRMFTPFERLIKKIIVLIIILITLGISAWIIFYLSQMNFELKNRYPNSKCISES